jgi:hypothetical protein
MIIPSYLLDRSITLTRGATTVTAQNFRLHFIRQPIVRPNVGYVDRGGIQAGEVTAVSLALIGLPTADIANGDTFTIGTQMYRVISIRPSEDAIVRVAECEVYN